ncbi:hypothetical protein [Natrinema salifodinae]|uniref:HEAT repeat-containing protein n=1 Tax=Natrinema salifodinae TaxID=1202768 RepID=A0A1I0NNG6_9EURY|nr:hypothetical protein [Natrinema salifodinae]SEW02815.1 hypothetical protein SAMN05216285_1925 [Natrinema salifodinae]
MSSRTPAECIDLALDDAATDEARTDAIHELKTANECDELAALVRRDELDDRYRRQALQSLATGQCDSMLRKLTEDEDVPQSLREEAEELFAAIDDN